MKHIKNTTNIMTHLLPRIHPLGLPFVWISFVFMGIGIFVDIWWIRFAMWILAVSLVLFFRYPKRQTLPYEDDSLILAGSDGVVLSVEENASLPEEAQKALGEGTWTCIRVFLSLTDVHVTWAPVSGKIVHHEHRRGIFSLAFSSKSWDNERYTWCVETASKKKIAFCQVAGFFARRIRPNVPENHILKRGQDIGIICFSSRFDVYVPQGYNILVQPGEKIWGCLSVLAHAKTDNIPATPSHILEDKTSTSLQKTITSPPK